MLISCVTHKAACTQVQWLSPGTFLSEKTTNYGD